MLFEVVDFFSTGIDLYKFTLQNPLINKPMAHATEYCFVCQYIDLIAGLLEAKDSIFGFQ